MNQQIQDSFIIQQKYSFKQQRYNIMSYSEGESKKIYSAVRNKGVSGGIGAGILSLLGGFLSFIFLISILPGTIGYWITEYWFGFMSFLALICFIICMIFILLRPKRDCYFYFNNDVFGCDEDPEMASIHIKEIYSAFGIKKYKLIERGKEVAIIRKRNRGKQGIKGTWTVEVSGKIIIDADNGLYVGILGCLLPWGASGMGHQLQKFTIYHTESAHKIGVLKYGVPQGYPESLSKRLLHVDEYTLKLSKSSTNPLAQKILLCLSVLLDYGERR